MRKWLEPHDSTPGLTRIGLKHCTSSEGEREAVACYHVNRLTQADMGEGAKCHGATATEPLTTSKLL